VHRGGHQAPGRRAHQPGRSQAHADSRGKEPEFFVKTGGCVAGPDRAGDTVVCEIDAIGRLSNPITL